MKKLRKDVIERIDYLEVKCFHLQVILKNYHRAESDGLFDPWRPNCRQIKDQILWPIGSIEKVEEYLQIYSDEMELLRGPAIGDAPPESLRQILKPHVDGANDFPWLFIGGVATSTMRAICGRCLPPLVLRISEGVQRFVAREVNLIDYLIIISGTRFLVHLGQCGHCGKIYWTIGSPELAGSF